MKKVFLALLVFVPLSFATICFAADSSIVVQPSKIEISAFPGQNLARSFSIINRSNFYAKLKVQVKDYRQTSQDGKLEFYTAEKEPASSWIVPQYLEIGLKPLETKQVGFVASLPKDFSGGGHYGAILFEPEGANPGANNFGILVLVTSAAEGSKNIAVAKNIKFSAGLLQFGSPINFTFKMENSGNSHFSSAGKLVLENWMGKEVGNYSLGQLTVYPKTSRQFSFGWQNAPYAGFYRAQIFISDPQTSKMKAVGSTRFIILPWSLIFIILAGGVALFFIFSGRKKLVLTLDKFIFLL